MKSASVIIGLLVGCLISGLTGYWSMDNINAAPGATFLWVHTFHLSVDGALVLPLLIMFVCEAVSCMPDILATAEISNVDIEGTEFNSRIQGGILCDGLGSLISALGTGPPMVSQAGNNGVISLTGCASRRAGWCASAFLILMGIFGKFGAVFGSMPPSVLGGMQVFLYSTIAVAGIRVLGLVPFTRRNRFILTARQVLDPALLFIFQYFPYPCMPRHISGSCFSSLLLSPTWSFPSLFLGPFFFLFSSFFL